MSTDSIQCIDNHTHIRIKKLPPLLINQLSAGEVVTRPASVIKELLENAVDAKATKITINIIQGGMGLIEVIDNGVGIHPQDMLMAVTRHATSKVADIEQLYGINTLGFRGEALASISAVARLTLISSHDNSGIGRCLTVAGHIDNPDITPVVCRQGTKVSVRDLYFNVPARRGNLKTASTEYAHIENIVRHIALVYTDVELSLFNDGKCRLNLNSSSIVDGSSALVETSPDMLLQRLKQALKCSTPEPSYPLFIDLSGLQDHTVEATHSNTASIPSAKIVGWFWLQQDFESNQQSYELPRLIYINARLVKDNIITQKIRQVCHALSLHFSHVGFALFFTLPSEWLNLNVHPNKERISIHALANITAYLETAVKSLLAPLAQKIHDAQQLSITEPAVSNKVLPNNAVSNNAHVHKQSDQQTVQADYMYPVSRQDTPQPHAHKVSSPQRAYKLDTPINSTTQYRNVTSNFEYYHYELELHCTTSHNKQNTKPSEELNEELHEELRKALARVLELSTHASIEHNNNISVELIADKSAWKVKVNDKCSSLEWLIDRIDRICSPWVVSFDRKNHRVIFEYVTANVLSSVPNHNMCDNVNDENKTTLYQCFDVKYGRVSTQRIVE